MAQRAKKEGSAGSGHDDLLEAVSDGLADAVPGIEVLDRDLVLDGGIAIDLVAADPSGALVLVVVAHSDPDQAVLRALDVAAFARRGAGLLARHLEIEKLRADLEPRTIVVTPGVPGAPGADQRLGARLSFLGESGVEVLCVRTVRSERGERSYLVPLPDGASSQGPLEPAPRASEVFLRSLRGEAHELAAELLARMERLDADVRTRSTRGAVVWSLSGVPLGRLDRRGELLELTLADDPRPRPLRSRDDAQRFVEDALASLIREAEPRSDPSPPSIRPAATQGRGGEVDEGGPAGLSPAEILTPEELQAFRD